MPKKFFIFTFGCQMNKADSQRVAGAYLARGWQEAPNPQEADDIIINTCSVRQTAEDRVDGLLQKLKKLPKNPKLILTGCMLYHDEAVLRKKLPTVDQFLPMDEVGFNHPPLRKDKTHAWVPISTGCNSFCTYCVVPFARGPEKSRPIDDIIREVEELIDKGYTHITLLGQNVNSYGLEKVNIGKRKISRLGHKMPTFSDSYKSYKTKPPFVVLLERLVKYKKLTKITFLTSNPWDFYDELIDLIAKHPVIDRFLHIPVQSGSNRILKLMNRWYTAEHYLELINKIKAKVPDAQIGTDIIVGFPTETEADFQAT
ncbi:MAG: radical SAM protein, partial [bacterium]|nr:radical SAM protein [bacterium]